LLQATARAFRLEGVGIELASTTSAISMSAPGYSLLGDFSGTDSFSVNVGGNVSINAGAGGLGISTGSAVFGLTSGTMSIFNNSGDVEITAATGDVVCDPGTGSFFVGTQATPILLVTPDGGGSWNYHIKAGKAWIADL
jgi:hypothetical protein